MEQDEHGLNITARKIFEALALHCRTTDWARKVLHDVKLSSLILDELLEGLAIVPPRWCCICDESGLWGCGCCYKRDAQWGALYAVKVRVQ